MTELETKYREESTDCPYRNLYIYYLKGRLNPDRIKFIDEFIGNWEEEGFSFLFFSRPCMEKVEDLLRVQPQLTLLDKFNMTYEEWQGGALSPFKIGNFLIAPPWNKPADKTKRNKKEVPILLDPGVVFGNGIHATTSDCLEALEMAFSEESIHSALDLGTGTGLLALAASRLSCKKTLALDFNFLAARTALRNVKLNGLEKRIQVIQARAEDFIEMPADLVIANIHYDVMKNLISSEGFLDKKWFILSGLLRSEACCEARQGMFLINYHNIPLNS
ncbi:MAG: 50S ribosomal protein L11 methyltransferase [Deltaproteobacteria bacterium]|nr:50S ribosomal protein L11 methyltransferase [Deltaproteobacteria bacterium]